jgi:hypothetical protein
VALFKGVSAPTFWTRMTAFWDTAPCSLAEVIFILAAVRTRNLTFWTNFWEVLYWTGELFNKLIKSCFGLDSL